MIPETPSRTTIGNRIRESVIASCLSPPGSPNGRDDERREDDQERGDRAEAEEQEPEQSRGDTPRSFALALLEQFAEDGDERGRERGIRDERANEVRHLEGDREGVDLAGGAEVVRGDDLADEAEDARDAGGDREDRGLPGESPAARGPLVYAARGLLIHAASIGTPSVGAARSACPRSGRGEGHGETGGSPANRGGQRPGGHVPQRHATPWYPRPPPHCESSFEKRTRG